MDSTMIQVMHPKYNVMIYKKVHAYTYDPQNRRIAVSVGECDDAGVFGTNTMFDTLVIQGTNFDFLMQEGSLHPSKPAGTFKPEDIDKMFDLGMYEEWN